MMRQLHALVLGWFFFVSTATGVIKVGDYNSLLGCKDWLGGCQERSATHPQGYSGAGGSCSSGCFYEQVPLGPNRWVALIYPTVGGPISAQYNDKQTCRKYLQSCPGALSDGSCSADCFFEGNTGE